MAERVTNFSVLFGLGFYIGLSGFIFSVYEFQHNK